MLDAGSLLIATAISGLCLCLTTLAFWLGARASNFIVTWSAGVAIIVLHIVAFWFYSQAGTPLFGVLSCALLPVGVVCLYAAARQYAEEARPMPIILGLSLPYLAIVPPIFAIGFDGVALILQNIVIAVVCGLCAHAYWRRRADAKASLSALSALYAILGLSFAICAIVLLVERQWSLGGAPENWAEEINVVVAVLCMTSIGALTLSIEQSRLASRNRVDALTDPLTGMLNRRGLDAMEAKPFGARKAIALFDFDHFKGINDTYGHAAGDEVIRRFAGVVRQYGRVSDHAVRLGGEEFAVIMNEVMPDQARKAAERIASAFAEETFRPDALSTFTCTVSAGIAFGDATEPSFYDVLARADRALYLAKKGGRNRIESGEWRLVG
jgi:diguanylate cyclase (GGDEF)-like protein